MALLTLFSVSRAIFLGNAESGLLGGSAGGKILQVPVEFFEGLRPFHRIGFIAPVVLQVEDFQQVPGQSFGEDQRALHIQMAVVIVVFLEGESQALNLRVGAVVQLGNLLGLKIGPHFFFVGGIDRRCVMRN